MDWGNPCYQNMLENKGIESSSAQKDLGALMGIKLDMSKQELSWFRKDTDLMKMVQKGPNNKKRAGAHTLWG